MEKVGTGKIIYDLRKQIQEVRADLARLGDPPADTPQLVDSANLVRLNEYLSKTDERKTQLISVYGQYSDALEEMLSSVFEIQQDLKEILKKQSLLIPDASVGKKPVKTPRKKPVKTPRKKPVKTPRKKPVKTPRKKPIPKSKKR